MAMRIQDYIIGMVIFSLVVVGFTLYVGDLEQNYPVTADPDFENTFSKINSTLRVTSTLEDKVTGEEVSSTSATTDAFRGALDAVRGITTSLTLIRDVFESFSEDLGLDPRFGQGIMIALGALLFFLIIAFIRGSIGGIG